MSFELTDKLCQCHRTVSLAIMLCFLINLRGIDCMICHYILSCSPCESSYSYRCDHLFRQAIANTCLEIVLTFLFLKAHVSVCTLSTGPDILHALASKFRMTLWCQEYFDTDALCNMLQHALLVNEIMTHAHDVSQTCAVINCPKVVFPPCK